MTFRMKARRAGWLLVVAAFAFGLFSAVRPTPAQAYGLISTRSIKMSSNINAATNVIYTVGFSAASTNANLSAIVIHFCANDPIIGDTCTVPNNFNDNPTTNTINNFSIGGTAQTSGWSIDTTNSQSNALILKRSSPMSITSGQAVTLDLGNGTANGITNPDTSATNPNTTFFARITLYTTATPNFSTDANAQTTEKSAYDAGGVAMSTNQQLNLTAKVQEQLTFCVYTTATCAGGANNGVINMGDPNGVLSATNQNYYDTSANIQLASNALGGVTVRLKGDTLTSGSFTITPDGPTCVADSTATNTEQFGVRVVSYGAGQAHPAAGKYDCLANNHMFDPTVTNTTYGDPFIVTSGATDVSTSNIEFAAKAANTTEAGVYKTTLQLIATATY